MNLTQTIGKQGSFEFVPYINGYTKVLSKDKLTSYWKRHHNNIIERNFKSEDREVLTNNYNASYTKDLDDVYKVLDELII